MRMNEKTEQGGLAGRVWFLPFRGQSKPDTPEVLAAMRLMRREPYPKAKWEPPAKPPAAS